MNFPRHGAFGPPSFHSPLQGKPLLSLLLHEKLPLAACPMRGRKSVVWVCAPGVWETGRGSEDPTADGRERDGGEQVTRDMSMGTS